MNWIEAIKAYKPYNEQEERDREVILHCIKKFDDVLTRTNEIAHITSSAFTVNDKKDKLLMVHHNIYNSWSWIGGHADGEENLLAVAIREAGEETGVMSIQPLSGDIFALDVLPVVGHVKKGSYVPAHLHLSVTFLLEADEKERLAVKKDENSDVEWIPLNKVNEYSTEPHMHKVYSKLISKLKLYDK